VTNKNLKILYKRIVDIWYFWYKFHLHNIELKNVKEINISSNSHRINSKLQQKSVMINKKIKLYRLWPTFVKPYLSNQFLQHSFFTKLSLFLLSNWKIENEVEWVSLFISSKYTIEFWYNWVCWKLKIVVIDVSSDKKGKCWDVINKF